MQIVKIAFFFQNEEFQDEQPRPLDKIISLLLDRILNVH